MRALFMLALGLGARRWWKARQQAAQRPYVAARPASPVPVAAPPTPAPEPPAPPAPEPEPELSTAESVELIDLFGARSPEEIERLREENG